MKTTITATLAALLLAGAATAAVAQDEGRHHRGQDAGRDRGAGGGDRPQMQDSGRRDRTGGEDRRGQRRPEFQSDQGRAVRAIPAAPAAPAAVQAPEPRAPRAQFRGDGRGREVAPQAQTGGGRDRGDNRGGDQRRWDGNRDGNRGLDANRDGRRDGDRNRGDRGGWNRNDDRGRPHWQQGRYPQVYRSHQRYRYGYYRPPVGFYAHSWAFGEFLPRGWYGSDYLLNDWWSYDLPYPPPGYDWVRVGSDALLIDEYTGRVVQVVRDIFW